MASTFCCIWGQGLALRGPYGAKSVHTAVDNMQNEQNGVFMQFLAGIVCYLLSHVIEMWIYFRPRIAFTVSIPLITFFLAILYYTSAIVQSLYLQDGATITGQVKAWGPYERIRDLDADIYNSNLKRIPEET